MYFKMLPTSSL